MKFSAKKRVMRLKTQDSRGGFNRSISTVNEETYSPTLSTSPAGATLPASKNQIEATPKGAGHAV